MALSDGSPKTVPTVALPALSSAPLARLAQKYELLGELRRAKRRGEPDAPRDVYRQLASEFPGALNELDTLTLRELDERASALRRASARGEHEPWMAWLDGYHRLMRAALAIKARVRGAVPKVAFEELARTASGWADVGVDRSFVELAVRPPNGRLVPAVFDCLGKHFDKSPDMLWTTLFPRRRASRSATVAWTDDVPRGDVPTGGSAV